MKCYCCDKLSCAAVRCFYFCAEHLKKLEQGQKWLEWRAR